MTCTMNLIKVKRSCAARRPHSLVQTHLGPAARQSQDGWRWGWVQWMTISVLSAPLSSLCIPQCAAGERLHVRFTYKKFLRTICRSPDFARWGRHTRNHQKPMVLGPSPGFARLSKRFTGVWPLHVLQLLGATGES